MECTCIQSPCPFGEEYGEFMHGLMHVTNRLQVSDRSKRTYCMDYIRCEIVDGPIPLGILKEVMYQFPSDED